MLAAADRIQYRSMILIYLVLGQPRFTEFDAHYFPEAAVPLTRLSEPRNYSTVAEPENPISLKALWTSLQSISPSPRLTQK